MPYSTEVCVRMHDVDLSCHLFPAAAMRLLHVAADCQMRDEGMSLDAVRKDGKAMILNRLALVFHEPVRQNESLSIETWPVAAHGFVLPRCYRAYAHGICAFEGVSTWALVDIATRRLLKSDKVDFSAFTHGEMLDLDPNIAPYDGEYEDAGEHFVGYSDTDLNRHMNNTRYIDMLCDFVPNIEERRVAALQIHYRNEAPMHETIRVTRAVSGDTVYFQTFCRDRINIEAAIRLA